MVEFGKLNKSLQLPSDTKDLFKDLPFKIGEQWTGKRVRNQDMYVEFGGPKVKAAAELIEIDFNDPDQKLKDGKIEIWGPDFDEIDEGSSYSFIEIISVSGSKLEELTPGLLEAKISAYHDFIEGIMHLNVRDLIWIRIHKSIAKKGIKIEHIARALIGQLKENFPQIEKVEIRFWIDSAQNPIQTLRILQDECYYVWDQRNRAALKLNDDEVDKFYGCKGCKPYFPNHACIITPNNYGTCGVLNWKDADRSSTLETADYFFKIPKGEKLDALYGNYTGVNSKISEFTNKSVNSVNLYSAITNPQTSCGCFEALVFYIPEVDALGIANFYYRGETPFEINFTTVIKIYNQNIQTSGYRGIALTSLMDEKFVQGDGGWKRVAWMNYDLKEKVKNWIPKDLISKIATEKNATTIKELKNFINKENHPVKNMIWNGKIWIIKEE